MLKVGLIGAGYLGKIHLSLLTQMNNIDLVGIFDIDTHSSALLSEQYKVRSFTNANHLIDACDALVVATPTSTHFDYAKNIIELGKHIFVEKPVAANVQEAASLLPLLNDHPVCFQVGMVERFNPAFVAALPFVANSCKVFCNRLAPFTPRGADVSVVLDVMIHDLDIVLSVVKSPVKQVRSYGQKVVSDTYDIATATVEFENGLIANFTASRMAERKYRLIEFVGKDNILKVDFLHKTSSTYQLCKNVTETLEEAYLSGNGELLKEDSIEVLDTNAIGEELKSFVDCIINNKKVVVSLDDGMKAMQLAKEIEDQMNHQN